MTTDKDTRQHRGNGFLIGFIAGTLVSAAVAIYLAPRSSGFRRRVTDTLKRVGEIADDVGNARRAPVADIKKHSTE